jgi:4-hydroxybenzoate polyprenyltransferase
MQKSTETPLTGAGGSTEAASDIDAGSWLLRATPARLEPYLKLARVDRPIGTWLLLFPCWWSLALALQATSGLAEAGWRHVGYAALFALGALVMRAAGCTINDIADRKIDAKVARTALRPLPAGLISLRQALVFLTALLSVGLAVLIQFNGFTIALGIASLALVVPYPLMKRITYWPQAWLGLTFNWGALMGWSAVTGDLGTPALLLYAAGFFWTLGYDTIYAHQDKEDDALIGVKSTALRLGRGTRAWLIAFYGLTVALLASIGIVAGFGWAYYLAVAGVGLHFAWQTSSLDTEEPTNCLVRFQSNRVVGWILLAGLLAATL